MTEEFLLKLRQWIAKGEAHHFYRTWLWRKTRRFILDKDKHECQVCKAKGLYEPATMVHHVQYLEKHPDLAVSEYYEYNGVKLRQLISLCDACHDKIHKRKRYKEKQITVERW